MKERFSVSMDDDLVKWLDKMVEEKIFSSRSHALEFCVKQFSKFPIQNIVKLHWESGESEPIFLTDATLRKLEAVMKERSLESKEEAVKFALAMLHESLRKKGIVPE